MKILIAIIITINLYAIEHTNTDTYTINIKKLVKCPKTKILTSETSIRPNNNKYIKKKTSIMICKTKKGKIKLTIKKTTSDFQ